MAVEILIGDKCMLPVSLRGKGNKEGDIQAPDGEVQRLDLYILEIF